MKMFKIKIDESNIEESHHMDVSNVCQNITGHHLYVRFNKPLHLIDLPEIPLIQNDRNVVLVYKNVDDNIMYTGIARRI